MKSENTSIRSGLMKLRSLNTQMTDVSQEGVCHPMRNFSLRVVGVECAKCSGFLIVRSEPNLEGIQTESTASDFIHIRQILFLKTDPTLLQLLQITLYDYGA